MKWRSMQTCVVAIDIAAVAFAVTCGVHGAAVEAVPGNAVGPDILLASGLVLTIGGWLLRSRDAP